MSAFNQTASKTLTPEQALLSEPPMLEEVRANECLITLRRVDGPNATELYFACKPQDQSNDAGAQAEAMYSALREILISEGGGLNSIVSETIFLRDLANDIKSVRGSRLRVLAASEDRSIEPAVTEIQQPPLDTSAKVEIAIQAMFPKAATIHKQQVRATSGNGSVSTGVRIQMEDEARLLAGGLCGDGEDAYEQTQNMFETAEKLLHEAGMEFTDVVRTWIYLRHMERDYPKLNRARREFFESRGVSPVPASTGIEGGMVEEKHDICLGFYAVKAGRPLMQTVMTSPTLNEAGEYGADFVRGMKMVESNKIALHISGTASIDEEGRTAHIGDIDAQIDRMILNIKALLAKQGADFRDIVYAYNYLKDPADEQLLKDKFEKAGLEGFPSVFVHAEVCRPNLLCETEVLAVLPRFQVRPADKNLRHLHSANTAILK